MPLSYRRRGRIVVRGPTASSSCRGSMFRASVCARCNHRLPLCPDPEYVLIRTYTIRNGLNCCSAMLLDCQGMPETGDTSYATAQRLMRKFEAWSCRRAVMIVRQSAASILASTSPPSSGFGVEDAEIGHEPSPASSPDRPLLLQLSSQPVDRRGRSPCRL